MFPENQNDDPSGTHEVWHQHPDGFRLAATVDTNLLGALVKPNCGPDHPLGQNVRYTEAWKRPTTFGDKLVNPKGQVLEIYKDKQSRLLAVRETTHPQQDNHSKQLDAAAARGAGKHRDTGRER